MSAPLYALLGVTGLGDVGYRFMDDAGAWIGARVTAGVDETDAADGTYYAPAPTTPGTARSVHWNSSGTPAVKATEVFDNVGDVVPGVDVVSISGDATAADNLETMLDGTGSQSLSLKSLVINNGAGVAVAITGTTDAVQIVGGNAAVVVGGGADYGFIASGVLAGMLLDSSTGPGLKCAGGGVGAGINAIGGATGSGFVVTGGVTSGAGMIVSAQAGDTNALQLTPSGDGYGLVGTIFGNITGSITGSLTGSVGSVTAAVSVTGDAATFATRGLGMIELDGAVYRYTTNSLELGPVGGSAPTVGQIADEVQTRTIAGVTLVATTTNLTNLPTIPANWLTAAGMAADASTEIATQVNTTLSAAHGAGVWGSTGGSGAFPITVTVNDGAVALQNVSVAVFDGAALAASDITAAVTGQVTFSLDAGTYTVALVKPGYTFTTASRTVTGNQTGTLTNALSMTQSFIAAPSSPDKCTVAGYIKDLQGNALPGAVLKARLVPPNKNRPITTNGNVVALESDEAVADDNGLVTFELIRTDEFDQDGCTYTFTCADADLDERHVALTAATLDLADL